MPPQQRVPEGLLSPRGALKGWARSSASSLRASEDAAGSRARGHNADPAWRECDPVYSTSHYVCMSTVETRSDRGCEEESENPCVRYTHLSPSGFCRVRRPPLKPKSSNCTRCTNYRHPQGIESELSEICPSHFCLLHVASLVPPLRCRLHVRPRPLAKPAALAGAAPPAAHPARRSRCVQPCGCCS